jgi:glutathione S-transferase
LSKADWLVGDKYSLADIASYSWVQIAKYVDVDLDEFPGVKKWLATIKERPAVQKAHKVPASDRTPEDIEKMFQGMRAKVDAMKDTDKHDS